MPPASAETVPAAGALSMLPDDELELLLLIRHFELELLDLYGRGELNGTTHTCLGQEYVPVAVSGLLRDGDFILSNHRGHGHYLARYRDPHGLLAEIMGRDGAICEGVGGSQHIRREGYLSTGVQGESLPVAAGIALHLKRTRPGAVEVTPRTRAIFRECPGPNWVRMSHRCRTLPRIACMCLGCRRGCRPARSR